MSFTATSSKAPSASTSLRLRNLATGFVFALFLMLPKLLRLRRNQRSWLAFRLLLGLAGAALVIFPLGLWNSWHAAIAGLAMFLASILLPPARPETNVDAKARELGALVVVNGGQYQPGNAPCTAVRLFTGAENVWALDSHLHPLLVIPAAEISSVRAEKAHAAWLLRVRWTDHTADFSYRGVFAEHLARVAETTIRGVMRPSLPVIPQRRAASA